MSELELRHSLAPSQVDELLALYRNEWWSRERDARSVDAMLQSSDLVFALIEPRTERLAAFAHVLTDGVYLAVLLDVIVAADFRGRGLGRRLVEALVAHPELSAVQSLELVCQPELVPFYRKWGFTDAVGASTLMRRTSAPALAGADPAR